MGLRNLCFFILLFSLGLKLSAQEVPDINISKLTLVDLEGNPVSIDSYKGKVVLINFWATWCKACVFEIPSIVHASEQLEGKNIVFLMVSDEGSKKIRKFQQKNNYELEFIQLKASFKEAHIQYVPTSLLIDKEGNQVEQFIGYKDWSAKTQLRKLSHLIER